jgi:hypothetical protein
MRGRLEEFNLGDILQLYQISGRTGAVRVWQEGRMAHSIYVDRGRVSGAGADDWNLIDAIRRIEWLPSEVSAQLDVIEREGGETGLSLIARALLSSDAWEYLSERLLEELVYPAITWQSGDFEATVYVIPRVAPLRVNLSPQQLVLNAARWDEEVRSAEESGFGAETRWVRKAETSFEVPGNDEDPFSIRALLDRPRSINELTAAAGMSILRVVDQIRQFQNAGLIERLD